jgi:ATP-binding cassette subfamily B protein
MFAQSFSDSLFLLGSYNQLLKKYRREYAIVVLGIVTQVAFFILYPLVFKYIFDKVIPYKDFTLLAEVVIEVIVLMVICAGGAYLQTKYMAKVGGRVLAELRLGMVKKLGSLPSGFYASVDTIDLLSRFSSDMDRLENSMTRALPSMVETFLIMLGCLITIATIDWHLAIAAAILLPIGFLGNAVMGPKEDQLNSQSRQLKNMMLSSVEDFINSWLLIRAFNDKRHIKGRFDSTNSSYTERSSDYSYYINISPVFSEYGVSVSLAIIVVLGAIFAIKGQLTVGAFIGCFALLRKVADGSAKTAKSYSGFINAIRPFRRIQKLLTEETISQDKPNAVELLPLSREIKFEEVTYGYVPEKLILDKMSLSIQAGTSVALVGASGSGKSTTTKLAMRILEPQSGSITFDGVRLTDSTIDSLRLQCSAVLQESHLFRGTIAENIRFGKHNASMEEVIEAAKKAQIHELVQQLPEGYETIVDERGSSLSGGQRQRIAIARAFIQNPSILFLDEPTSMLDPITESSVNEAFMELSKGRTVIMVTHRLASARHFDKIIVIDQGKVAEEGSHEELMALGGKYRALWDKQHGFSISPEGYIKVTPERLRSIPIFSSLDQTALEGLAREFSTETFEPGVSVIQEGAKGDKFYIAVRGSLQVLKKGPDGVDKPIVVLSDGDHFGEIALLKSVPRTASLKTLAHTSCLSLSHERFSRLVESQPALLKALEESMAARK